MVTMNDKKITIEYHSLAKDFMKNLGAIILVILIARMSIYVINYQVYNPEYTATATLVVTSKSASTANTANYDVSTELASIFTNIFTDPIVAAKASEHLGREFNGSISAAVDDGTNFIDLMVTSESPKNSYEMLNAVVAVYPQVSNYVFDNATIMMIKAPEVPHNPSNRISSGNSDLILSGTGMIAAFIVFVLSVFRDTVKNEEDYKNKIGAKLLGIIGHESKKLTFKDLLKGQRKKRSLRIHTNAFVGFGYVENIYKVSAKLEHLNNRHGDKVFMFTSVLENEGKTSVASNVALALAEKGKNILLVDFDFKKPAVYKFFDLDYAKNL
jgi:capsular polysaccharide biosynthesis protein